MVATKKPAKEKNEIRIKEEAEEEYFRHRGGEILPPELNITIRDGFKFGIGFILASLIFYTIVMVGIIIFIRVAPSLNIG